MHQDRHARSADRQAWIGRARAVPIEDEIARRNIKLQRQSKSELVGPCPVCGGTDRFSINTKKQVFNCRGCRKGGSVVDMVQHLDECDFDAAVIALTGERQRVNGAAKPNGSKQPTAKQEASKEIAETY